METSRNKKNNFRTIPKWLTIAPVLLLITIFLVTITLLILDFRAIKRETKAVISLTHKRGAQIISNFEATVLSSPFWTDAGIYNILQQLGKAKDIHFIAVTDRYGIIIAANDPNLVGELLLGEAQDPGSDIAGSLSKRKIMFNPNHDDKTDSAYFVYKNIFSEVIENESYALLPPSQLRYFLMRDKELAMVISFNVDAIRKAQLLDDQRSTFQLFTIIFLFGFAIFSFFILRAYQKSYKNTVASRAYTLALMDALPIGVIVLSAEDKILALNPSAEKLLNKEEGKCVNKEISQILPIFKDISFKPDLKNRALNISSDDDIPFYAELSSFPILSADNMHVGHALILRDINEIQQLQAELHKNERLVSIGKLAAGVAHEIKNPLSAIKGFAHIFKENAESNSDERQLAEIMTQEIMRVDKVINDLLLLSKPDKVIIKEIELETLLEKAKNSVIIKSTEYNIHFHQHIDHSCHKVSLDYDRMIQVLQNLFLNAIDAMPKGGTIGISAHILEKNKANEERFKSEKTLQISIKDTGCGIPTHQMSNIFTPYFTSKATGTGLGLVMVQKIIEAHGGEIKIESTVNVGTEITMLFPQ